MAPIKTIQIDSKNATRLTQKTRTLMAMRNTALIEMKSHPTIGNICEYKNLRNQLNKEINKKNWKNSSASFREEKASFTDKWKLAKKLTGQKKFKSPQLTIEGNKHHISPGNMVSGLNRLYIQKVKSVIAQIPQSDKDPLVKYKQAVGEVTRTFTFQQISMGELSKYMDKMKPTGSAGADDISMRSIKDARAELQPLLLLLINQSIKSRTFPNQLKQAKIVPIEKTGKNQNTVDGWRPMNVIPAISKVLERVLLAQILNHLEINNLIGYSHHGAIRNKSTQTMVNEIYDNLLENLNNGDDTALIMLDQSKAYKIVNHKILLRKLSAIGFTNQATDLMESFLSERTKYVQIHGMKSETLVTGPQSVIQGSAVSCVLFLIFVLDLPQIFHVTNHKPEEQLLCQKPNAKTFVDDVGIIVRRTKDDINPLDNLISSTMEEVGEYMAANKLALNQDKSTIMLVTKNVKMKDEFKIQLGGKIVRHSKSVKILSNVVSDDLTWDRHVKNELIPSLQNRARTLRLIQKYMDPKYRALYAQSIFKSKILFGAESWRGASKTLLNKVQSIQDKVVKMVLGPEHYNKSNRQKI